MHHQMRTSPGSWGRQSTRIPVLLAHSAYPLWAEGRFIREAAYLSVWVGLAELALGGCTTADHLYVAAGRRGPVDRQITAAKEVPCPCTVCGSMTLSGEKMVRPLPDLVGGGRRTTRYSPTASGR